MFTNLFLILKIATVLFFLFMFWRGSKLIWGIGLLAATSALLLDTFLSTFGRDEMVAELGFFFYLISGALFAGGAAWLWGLLQPYVRSGAAPAATKTVPRFESVNQVAPTPAAAAGGAGSTAFDRQMLFNQVRYRFAPDDILDLVFDLQMNENDVVGLNADTQQIIVNIMDLAEQRSQTGPLALAVERILTPLPRESLPRLEKLSSDSPPNVLRHYMLANYTLDQLAQMAAELEIDWEQLAGSSKQSKVRNLLLYVDRRNRLDELLNLMQAPLVAAEID